MAFTHEKEIWLRRMGKHSRTASTLDRHRVDSVVRSRCRAFHGENQTTKKKSIATRFEPSIFPREGQQWDLLNRDAAEIGVTSDSRKARKKQNKALMVKGGKEETELKEKI